MSAHAEAHTGAIPPASRADRLRGGAFRVALLSTLVVSCGLLAILVWDVARDGVPRLSVDFLTSPPSALPRLAGIEPAIMGTIWLMGLCALFIIPVGVASAIYLEEYADTARWWNRLIEINIQNLAAVPSIVYGILGLAFLV
ncbi:MAG: phosphate transport system permease protein, partial [bacterium]